MGGIRGYIYPTPKKLKFIAFINVFPSIIPNIKVHCQKILAISPTPPEQIAKSTPVL